MSDLNDIFSCDQLDALVKAQEALVSHLGWEVAKAAAETNARHRQVEEYERQYNEYKNKKNAEIAETKTKLNNTPKQFDGKPIPTKNPEWQQLNDELAKQTATRDEVLGRVQAAIDSERVMEEWAKDAQTAKEAELAKARQYLQQLKDAASKCRKTKKSGIGGGILIGVGFGFALLGGILFHGGSHKPIPVADDKPAVVAPVPQQPQSQSQPSNDGGLPLPQTPHTPKSNGSVKPSKPITDQPLGEDPQPQTQPEPQSDKTDSGNSENITTGDSHATGNDSSSDGDYSYEVSDSGGNTSVGNDSSTGSNTDGDRAQEEQSRREPRG
jgi:hypothetical protein